MHRFRFAALLGAAWVHASVLSAQESQTKWYDRITIAGDFRLRHESFFQDGAGARGRLRVRLRAGVTAPLSARFTTGFRLASAESGSVTSHNVSLTGAQAPKSFVLDRAYVTWTPSARFTVTGGKFANPLQRPAGLMRTELLFDDEVAPEGLHEQVNLVSNRTGTVRRVALLAEQWTLLEASAGPDTWMLGGQAVADLAPSARTTVSLAGGYYGYLRGRALATARNTNSALFVSNSVVLRDGTVVTGGKALSPSASNPFASFVSDFRLVNGSAGVAVDRAVGRMPLQFYIDAVHNAGAEEERTGWWSGLTLGASRAKGDWATTVVWAHVEREAVVSMYSYSDLGFGGTNVEGPILTVQYRPARELSVSFRHHYIKPILTAPGDSDARLHRIMVDAAVSF